MEYDFRTRFNCGLNVIGRDMTLAEASRHVERFCADPSSALAAEIAGWEHPISREALALYDLFDLMVLANSDPKKPRPEPHGGRPFKAPDTTTKRRGDAAGRTREEVVALLRTRFGQPEAPI